MIMSFGQLPWGRYIKVGYILLPVNQNTKKGWRTPTRYISIEIATKPRPQCDLTTFLHKRIHVCLCCFEQNWNELELIKKRKSKYDDTIIWESNMTMY